jgi:hypothetical protein
VTGFHRSTFACDFRGIHPAQHCDLSGTLIAIGRTRKLLKSYGFSLAAAPQQS